ncbi:MAG: hypothetical protein HQ592_15650 [Planctomycetes bacterium]|nr:hypothetical protein [Planctomycetota bacterium]
MRNGIRTSSSVVAAIAILLAAGLCAGLPTADAAGITRRISLSPDGAEGDGDSGRPTISGNGRFVVFGSMAGNLVPDDTNEINDVFVYDCLTGRNERISVKPDGTQVIGPSMESCISADGDVVALSSMAWDLDPTNPNGMIDIYVQVRQTGETARITGSWDGSTGSMFSVSGYPKISADGRFVSFHSMLSNLLPGDDPIPDIFVHDRQTAQTTIVSVASDGTKGNDASLGGCISGDGRYVAFVSTADNLVDDDDNVVDDVFVHDRQTGQTTRVSVATDGTQADMGSAQCCISADGRYVAFKSEAGNLVPDDTNDENDVFVHDRQTGQTTRVSIASDGTEADDDSFQPSLSVDGRYVAFDSEAANLVPGDTNEMDDVFVHDRQTGRTSRVSMATDGTQGDHLSTAPSISANGRFVTFQSLAGSLVPDDTNEAWDVFIHERLPGDLNGDCHVNIVDLIRVRDRLHQDVASGDNWQADVNGDGRINILDMLTVRNRLNAQCN